MDISPEPARGVTGRRRSADRDLRFEFDSQVIGVSGTVRATIGEGHRRDAMEFDEFDEEDVVVEVEVEVEEDDDVEDDRYLDATSFDLSLLGCPFGPFSASEGNNGGLFGVWKWLVLNFPLLTALDESLEFGVGTAITMDFYSLHIS